MKALKEWRDALAKHRDQEDDEPDWVFKVRTDIYSENKQLRLLRAMEAMVYFTYGRI